MLTHALAQPVRNHPPFAARVLSFPERPNNLGATFETLGGAVEYTRNEEIFGEGEPIEYLYRVQDGAVRIYKMLDDGRRQINGFYLPGDIFGIEAGELHHFSAEAVTASRVLLVKRSKLAAVAERQSGVANELWSVTARELDHVQNLMMTLGRKNAQERVAAFLLEMAERACKGQTIELPMSRQDIADYLGLTIETVSRTFTQLENSAAIELPSSRRVVLRNRGALARLNA